MTFFAVFVEVQWQLGNQRHFLEMSLDFQKSVVYAESKDQDYVDNHVIQRLV